LSLFKCSFSGKKCAYLGLEGIGYPTNVCMYHQDDTGSFAFNFQCSKNGVSANYWDGETKCNGNPTLSMDDYYCVEPSDVTGQECSCVGRGGACDTFSIKMSDDERCDNANTSQLTSIVVDECIPTGYGGSTLFQCDDTTLSQETFTECDDCSCVSVMNEFDYDYLNDNICFDITCNSGKRLSRKHCEENGGGDNLQNIIGKDIISEHIQNHHLFVHNIITKHQLANNPRVDPWDIFGNDGIWRYHKLLYGLGGIAVAIIFISIVAWCRRDGQYSKI